MANQPSFGYTPQGTYVNKPNQRIDDNLTNKSFSLSLPNWTDTFTGISSAVIVFLAQQRYIPELAMKTQELLFHNTSHKEAVTNCISIIPAAIIGSWVFFELRQYTTSGLYDRATAVLSNLNFKCCENTFSSTYDFFQYIAHYGDAKELRIINDEFNYVMTYKFLSKILLELTYALRLLERSLSWASDSSFKANVDSMMYAIRLKIKNVTHNKMIFEHDPQYRAQFEQYQAQQHLANEDQIANTVVDQHNFSKIKFVIKTIGKIIGFFFGKRS